MNIDQVYKGTGLWVVEEVCNESILKKCGKIHCNEVMNNMANGWIEENPFMCNLHKT